MTLKQEKTPINGLILGDIRDDEVYKKLKEMVPPEISSIILSLYAIRRFMGESLSVAYQEALARTFILQSEEVEENKK